MTNSPHFLHTKYKIYLWLRLSHQDLLHSSTTSQQSVQLFLLARPDWLGLAFHIKPSLFIVCVIHMTIIPLLNSVS